MSKERPIIFTANMVNAILAGNKTQTRRIIKPQPDHDAIITVGEIGTSRGVAYIRYPMEGGITTRLPCKYGAIGDKLWVRETWSYEPLDELWVKDIDHLVYRADYNHPKELNHDEYPTWKPSIYMPRWASRILLEITDIRVEHLNDISESDAISEGIEVDEIGHAIRKNDDIAWGSAKGAYAELWERINGEGSWSQNKFVWVILFKRI